jgi:hypothetical protein
MEKIAVVAAMPSATAATAVPVNPGFRRNIRIACRTSAQMSLISPPGSEAAILWLSQLEGKDKRIYVSNQKSGTFCSVVGWDCVRA